MSLTSSLVKTKFQAWGDGNPFLVILGSANPNMDHFQWSSGSVSPEVSLTVSCSGFGVLSPQFCLAWTGSDICLPSKEWDTPEYPLVGLLRWSRPGCRDEAVPPAIGCCPQPDGAIDDEAGYLKVYEWDWGCMLSGRACRLPVEWWWLSPGEGALGSRRGEKYPSSSPVLVGVCKDRKQWF